MNVKIHPSQWFQHWHMQGTHVEQGHRRSILHNETFWMITVILAVFVAVVALAILVGQMPVGNTPRVPTYPLMGYPY
jgi:hypothetical protein